ncbi:ABC transporter substrate-binding protein [Parafrankia sp. EUN1f]|uniref:ABC transporter substrate-binding protein n=1 Tax=Parafrankia sp. EUN1f TaxID=102897 RepID=UPI0001C449DC|nr:ABC transporter substrate-binding protein [Parafrankia sp. EUN1f]EFC85520.1 ABC-type branched-chain amino acid transport systems periplasmic component-like protein [Parafrankia sp. EUN1f]
MKNRRALAVIAATGLLSAALAACGGGSDDGAAADTAGLTGDPIVVEVITPLSSVSPPVEVYHGALAAASAVNASGGINGRPLTVKVCDAGGTDGPAKAVECARNLVADKTIIAEVGDYEAYQEQVNTILAAAGVPNIGPPPQSQSVLNSKNSFPLAGSEGAALGTVLADAGAKKIQVAYTNIAQAASAVQFNEVSLERGRGLKITGSIPIDLTATDLTPAVTRGAEGDAVALAAMPTHFAAWLTVARGGDFDQKISSSASALVPSALSALGDKADGVLVSAGLPIVTSDEPGIVRFRDEMAKYQPGKIIDQVSLYGWLDTWAFAQVARTIDGPVTRESTLKAFSNLNDFNVFGLLPDGFSTTKPFDALPGMPRLFNQQIVEGVVKDGKLQQTSEGYVPIFTKP